MTSYPGPMFPSKSTRYTGPYCPAIFEQHRERIEADIASATDARDIERLTAALQGLNESERAMRDGD